MNRVYTTLIETIDRSDIKEPVLIVQATHILKLPPPLPFFFSTNENENICFFNYIFARGLNALCCQNLTLSPGTSYQPILVI